MKNFLIALTASILLSGCSIFFDVSAGAPLGDTRIQKYMDGDTSKPTRDGFAGSGAIIRAAIQAEHKWSDRVTGYCQLSHTSNSHSGFPFNEDVEGYINEAGCGARIKIW